jgi:hypothetical protein
VITIAAVLALALQSGALEPWASDHHPKDVSRRHEENVKSGPHAYVVVQGGTMDGTNCRSPVGGGFGIWEQTWESNRCVRLENVGDQDVVNPWLSNGRNNIRTAKEIIESAVRPGMTEREKAIALWRWTTTHRFHAGAMERVEMHDPVKIFNIYGYTTCGDTSVTLSNLWRAAGLRTRAAHTPGHCIPQVFFDGDWHLFDADMGPFYLRRDNVTIAGEQDLVRDHDLVKRAHGYGILDPGRRAADEGNAALFIFEGEPGADRPSSSREATMAFTLRPNEAIEWRWGRLSPPRYHGRCDIKIWRRAEERISNGRWIYAPDFGGSSWSRGVEAMDGLLVRPGLITPVAGKTGYIVWKMRSPYVFVGGGIEVDGPGTRFFLSWDGTTWQEVDENWDALFPPDGPARYEYWLKCELPAGAKLRRLAIANDLQMAPLTLPGMAVGENRFVYTDASPERRVRISHEWVERSLSRPPAAPAAAVSPADGAETDGTDLAFEWSPAEDPDLDAIADYHFELSDREDLAWPLSSVFEKLISNTPERGTPRYRLPQEGLLAPGRRYYWHVRAKDAKGVWGPWSRSWSFTAGGPNLPVEVSLGSGTLRWTPNPGGPKAVRYRVYGSDEKGFSPSDRSYTVEVGGTEGLSSAFEANFVAETTETALGVLGLDLTLPNANKAFYRVVAVDDRGKRSGASDYAAAPRPFITSRPPTSAKLGAAFACSVSTIRSLGDLRARQVEGDRNRQEARFWDIEIPRFTLVEGPAWLRIDETSGKLHGVPDVAGRADVAVQVVLVRPVRVLDEARLAWGHEVLLESGTRTSEAVTQRFTLTVER